MTNSAFRFCDDLGPKTILHLYEPAIGLKAIAVVDNTAAGPASRSAAVFLTRPEVTSRNPCRAPVQVGTGSE